MHKLGTGWSNISMFFYVSTNCRCDTVVTCVFRRTSSPGHWLGARTIAGAVHDLMKGALTSGHNDNNISRSCHTDHVRGYLIDFDMFYTHAAQCTHCNVPTLGQKWFSFCPNGVPCVFNGEPDWTLWALLLTLVSTCYGCDKTQSM